MVTNEHDVYCAQPQCRTKIFRKGAAVLALEARSLKGGGMGGVDPGFMHWYDTEDQMAFDNIAFLREQPRPAEEVQAEAAAAEAAAAAEEVREFVLAKEADEGLGTQFEDEDDMRLEELVEGGAAERNAGMQAFVGWTLLEIEGRPVTCCDDVRAASAGAVSVALKFALRKAPPASQPRLLVCAGCERDVIGFAEGGRFSIAAKLVDIGSEAAPNVSVAAASSPAAAELLALLQQEEDLKKAAAATPEA